MKINENLAEFIGIVIGDRHIDFQVSKNKKKVYCLAISGSFSNDLEYHKYINNLFFGLFKEELTITRQRKDEILSRKYSKKIVTYLKYKLQLPTGNKNNCRIPSLIMVGNNKIKCYFLRGLADTDFSLTFKNKNKKNNSYPAIKASLKSKLLIEDLEIILKELGFNFRKPIREMYYDKRTNKWYTRYSLYLYGVANLEKWIKEIGFKNNKHLTKYLIWKKFGYCPSNTKLKERQEFLKNSRTKIT